MEGSIDKQVANAYRRMASEGRYRPAAPSDGFGTIYMPIEELDLDDEIRRYSEGWKAEERRHEFAIGVGNFPTVPAMVFAIEAARCMCGVDDGTALRLLKLAVDELKRLGVKDDTPPPWNAM
jgi:hypothetical protein